MPMIRAMRLLNAVEVGTTSGAQLETLLTADPSRLAEFNVLMGMRGQTRRMAASSTAMTAVAASSAAMAAVIASSTAMAVVAASSTAMEAVIASSTAMAAVIASSTAMAAVAASSTAMAAVIASSTARGAFFGGGYSVGKGLETLTGSTNATLAGLQTMAAVIASSTAMTAVAASSTAMAAMAAPSTAMAAVAASKTALLACWNSETALAALRAAPSALTALLASPFKSAVGNGSTPTSLTTAMLAGKTILLQSRNNTGSDTNTLATKYQNGSPVANHVYTSTTSNTTQMVAFLDIKHTAHQGNHGWYGDVVKVD